MNPSDLDTRLIDWTTGHRDEFVDLVARLCAVESPSDQPKSQEGVHRILSEVFGDLGFTVRRVQGRSTGDHLLIYPTRRRRGAPLQLLIGHSDTVWPIGTLARMPISTVEGRLHGPGTLDMKGGVALAVLALRALRDLGRTPTVTPVLFVNADEEIGSPDSVRHVRRLARAATRALVLEPALGTEGRIKTARKGVGQFEITIRGRASHAGLDPAAGVSAIGELGRVIDRLHALGDPERGATVNVGVVSGGTRANVVAAEAHASVDLRVVSAEDGDRITHQIQTMRPEAEGASYEVSGGLRVPPLERTPRNRALWERAREEGRLVGLTLGDALAGGGSDGNTTSLYTATLDGLGCVGDGAHADHEHIDIDRSLERCALLARLLLLDAPAAESGS